MSPSRHFTDKELKKIREEIELAEKKTSGEIRLYIEDKCPGNQMDRAAFIFHELKMDATRERNGVLFYLALVSRQFAIIGDAGIHAKVGDDFWNEIRVDMEHHFGAGQFSQGLINGIRAAGDALKNHFPYREDDIDELPNDIVFGKNKE